jgi:hypothetical protein
MRWYEIINEDDYSFNEIKWLQREADKMNIPLHVYLERLEKERKRKEFFVSNFPDNRPKIEKERKRAPTGLGYAVKDTHDEDEPYSDEEREFMKDPQKISKAKAERDWKRMDVHPDDIHHLSGLAPSMVRKIGGDY